VAGIGEASLPATTQNHQHLAGGWCYFPCLQHCTLNSLLSHFTPTHDCHKTGFIVIWFLVTAVTESSKDLKQEQK